MRSVAPYSPILFHTDVSRIERATLKKMVIQQKLLTGFEQYLDENFPDQDLWFPAFNYDYMATRIFDLYADQIQVGALNEYLRNSGKYIRSEVPTFSIIRSNSESLHRFREEVNPFDQEGEFEELLRLNGNICFFGASIASLTFIHYVENLVEVPYRYLKTFPGKIVSEGRTRNVTLSYFVRPIGISLHYDWEKIHRLLQDAEMAFKVEAFGNFEIYNVRELTEFMLDAYSEDIYWTLSEDSKIETRKRLESLGRNFEITDFESEKSGA